MPQYVKQFTPQYKTYLKRATVEALTASFANHPDPTVASAKVAVDYTEDDFRLPAVIIKFNEGRLPNAGVGHYEWLPSPDNDPNFPPTLFVEYQHRFYKGTIEFEIFGESSADRDIVSDAVIEVLAMDEVSSPGQSFLTRFYDSVTTAPYGLWHLATLNVDDIDPLGESAQMAPWVPEDQLVYQTGYRVGVFGEFYSYTPPSPKNFGPVEEVDVYSWPVGDRGDKLDPTDALDPLSPPTPVPDADYAKYTGFPPGEREVPEGD